MCMLAAQPSMQAACAVCVCQAWCNALRGMHVFSCMYLVQRHLAPSDAVSMSATCQSFARMFARARTRMIARAKRIEMKHMVNNLRPSSVDAAEEFDEPSQPSLPPSLPAPPVSQPARASFHPPARTSGRCPGRSMRPAFASPAGSRTWNRQSTASARAATYVAFGNL